MFANLANMKIGDKYSSEATVELMTIADVKKELSDLKAIITGEILDLKSRISFLEKKSQDSNDEAKLWKLCNSGDKKETHFSGSSCNSACISFTRLISLKAIQIIWLFFCFVVVIYFGISRFIIAHQNETAIWKPEKKIYTIDYTTGNPAVIYKNPELHLMFYLTSNTKN